MVHDTPLLVRLMTLIDAIPLPPPGPHGRGRPVVYGDHLFLKASVLMVVRRLPTVHGLLAVLTEPEMAPVRATPGASSWARSWSVNSPCSIAMPPRATSASALNRCSRRPDDV